MITISNTEKILLSQLKFDIDSIRTRAKDYAEDELFKTMDNKYLILCHTISEAGMGSYYCQQAIFRNNDSCELLINMNNFWTPHWINNFKYMPSKEYYSTSVTCYDKESKSNPTPTIIFDILNNHFSLEDKDNEIQEEYNSKKGWVEWKIETNLCELFKREYAM